MSHPLVILAFRICKPGIFFFSWLFAITIVLYSYWANTYLYTYISSEIAKDSEIVYMGTADPERFRNQNIRIRKIEESYQEYASGLGKSGSLKFREKDFKLPEGAILSIASIGIREPMYQTGIIKSSNDFRLVQSGKEDEGMVNIELVDKSSILSGFLIGGHSSGYSWDSSARKNVFRSLDRLKVGDKIKLEGKNMNIEFRAIGRSVMGNNEKLAVKGKFYLYTCYPVGSSKNRLVIELTPEYSQPATFNITGDKKNKHVQGRD